MFNELTTQLHVVQREEELAVGMAINVNEDDFEGCAVKIHELWGRFMAHKDEIAAKKPNQALGIGHPTSGEKTSKIAFTYIAALPVHSVDNVPPGMVSYTTPAGRYAVYTHKGKLKNLPVSIKHLWEICLPESGLDYNQGYLIEVYDSRFSPDSDTSEIDLYVPLG